MFHEVYPYSSRTEADPVLMPSEADAYLLPSEGNDYFLWTMRRISWFLFSSSRAFVLQSEYLFIVPR